MQKLFFSIIITDIVSTFHHGFWQLVIIKLCPEWQRVNYNVHLTLWYLYSGYITEFMTFYFSFELFAKAMSFSAKFGEWMFLIYNVSNISNLILPFKKNEANNQWNLMYY